MMNLRLIYMGLLSNEIIEISIENITLGSSQARQRDTIVNAEDDLVHSIRKDGMTSPVIVKKLPDGKFELIAGQRRLQVHKILNKSTISARYATRDIDEFEAKRISLGENTARKEMTRADYVDIIDIYMGKYRTVKTVAEELGLSESTIRKYIAVSSLPKDVQEAIQDKTITQDNAFKALNALGGDESDVNTKMLIDTAIAMKPLSPEAKKKVGGIMQSNPGITPTAAVEKAKNRARSNILRIDVTEDQIEKIEKFKTVKGIDTNENAVSELIGMGLTAANV